MPLHSAATKTLGCHNPIGASDVGTYVPADNQSQAHVWRNPGDTQDLFRLDTTTGALQFVWGNDTDDPDYIFGGGGDFNVDGNIHFADGVIGLSFGHGATTIHDIGIHGERAGDDTFHGWDESADEFVCAFTDSDSDVVLAVNITDYAPFHCGALVVDDAASFGGSEGAAGQVLTSNGAGVAPTWQAGGGGGGVPHDLTDNASTTILTETGGGGAGAYFVADLTDGLEDLQLGNATTNPTLTWIGTGDATFENANIGIGTTAPADRLHIVSNTTDQLRLEVNVTTSGADLEFHASGQTTPASINKWGSAGGTTPNEFVFFHGEQFLRVTQDPDITWQLTDTRAAAFVIRQGTAGEQYLVLNTTAETASFPGVDVAIGHSSPSAPLHIQNNTTSHVLLEQTSTAAAADLQLSAAGEATVASITKWGSTGGTTPTEFVFFHGTQFLRVTENPDVTWQLTDNRANAYRIRQGTAGEQYLHISTATGSEQITFGQTGAPKPVVELQGWVQTTDSFLIFNVDEAGGSPTRDGGFFVDRGTTGFHAGFWYDQGVNEFRAATVATLPLTATDAGTPNAWHDLHIGDVLTMTGSNDVTILLDGGTSDWAIGSDISEDYDFEISNTTNGAVGQEANTHFAIDRGTGDSILGLSQSAAPVDRMLRGSDADVINVNGASLELGAGVGSSGTGVGGSIKFFTGATFTRSERGRITNAGFLGWGATAPTHFIHALVNQASNAPLLKLENDGTGAASMLFTDDSDDFSIGVISGVFTIAPAAALNSNQYFMLANTGNITRSGSDAGNATHHSDVRSHQTSAGSTPETIWSLTLTEKQTVTVRARLTASDTGNTEQGGWVVTGAAYRETAGSAVLIGQTVDFDQTVDATASQWDVEIDVNTNDVRLRVVGDDANAVDFVAIIEYTILTTT